MQISHKLKRPHLKRNNFGYSPSNTLIPGANTIIPEAKAVVLEAVRLSRELDIDRATLASLLHVTEITLYRIIEVRAPIPEKTISLARLFIEVHSCINSLAGGDRYFTSQWIKMENDFLGSAPIEIMGEPAGFNKILGYLKGRLAS